MQTRKSYALVGSGGRSVMFLHPLVKEYTDTARLVALCDLSDIRMKRHLEVLGKDFGLQDEVACYAPEDFEKMLAETKPDTVFITTVDSLHADYILRSLQAGCNVIVEKPIAINAEQCRAIQEAARKSDRNVRVTFNFRWSPGVTAVRKALQEGSIGNIKHVNFEYLLDTSHGADYFRRWHSNLKNSGGLLVHKSTHHFDLINWWIDSIPETIFAFGDLNFYGKQNAIARGDEAFTKYDRYTGNDTQDDPFTFDLLADERAKKLYYDAEKDSGYIRDQNVFRDGIDIYDTMSVNARYRSNCTLNYSLVAYSPYEGFRVSITGDRGRLEYYELHNAHLIVGQSDEELAAQQKSTSTEHPSKQLQIFPHFKPSYKIPIQELSGGHGGGDPLIVEQIFSKNPPVETAHRNAGWEQGIASAIIGISANESIASGKPVKVSDLITLRPEATKLSELI
ncbi:MAG: Gfo/Idh/MocA family oxidoreductase [Chthoniobacterales bacterium]